MSPIDSVNEGHYLADKQKKGRWSEEEKILICCHTKTSQVVYCAGSQRYSDYWLFPKDTLGEFHVMLFKEFRLFFVVG